MKTHSVKAADIKKQWVIVDAADQALGRVASQIAYLLRGKHKTTFVPHLDGGDNVVVINADKIRLTGLKWKDKVYYHHTSYVGGIKAIKADDLVKKDPSRMISHAVKGMLPANKLGRQILKNMKVYSGAEHPHEAQKPVAAQKRTIGKGE